MSFSTFCVLSWSLLFQSGSFLSDTFFSFCRGRKYRFAYGLNWYMRTSTTSSRARPPSGSKSTISTRSQTGLSWNQQNVSAYYSPLLQSHTSSTRVVTITTHIERQTRLFNTPNQSSSTKLTTPLRDHYLPPSRDTRQCRVLFILHAIPCRWLPNGHPQPNRLLPWRIRQQRPRHL